MKLVNFHQDSLIKRSEEPKSSASTKKGRKQKTLKPKPSFDRTQDIVNNLASTSSTTFSPTLFSSKPANNEEVKVERKTSFDS